VCGMKMCYLFESFIRGRELGEWLLCAPFFTAVCSIVVPTINLSNLHSIDGVSHTLIISLSLLSTITQLGLIIIYTRMHLAADIRLGMHKDT